MYNTNVAPLNVTENSYTFQIKVPLYVLSVQIRMLATAWNWPCGLGSEELTPLLQRKLTRVASNTLTISHSQCVAFLQP